MWKLHSAFAYALMVLTAVIGFAPEGTTNKAWIALPFGLSIQPSEILKLSMILTLAFFFEKNNLFRARCLRQYFDLRYSIIEDECFLKKTKTM